MQARNVHALAILLEKKIESERVMKYIIKKVNTIRDYARTCAHDFSSIEDLKALRDYYNEISIEVINSADRENTQHCNMLEEICERLDMLLNDRDIYTFDKLANILFESLRNDKRHLSKDSYNKLFALLYHLYMLHYAMIELTNTVNINDIFKD